MTIYNWPNGVGGDTGDTLGTCAPLSFSGNVWFVNSATGDNAYNGGSEQAPKSTLAGAYAAAAAGDIIVLMDGHTETLTTTLTIALAGLTIVGLGSSGGYPTVKFHVNSVTTLFSVTAAGVTIRNIWMEANQQEDTSARISVAGANFKLLSCYIACDQYDGGSAVTLAAGADSARLEDVRFVNTATSNISQPATAMLVGGAISDLWLIGVVFDAGTAGFANFYAADLSTAAITRIRGENVTLKNGADIRLHASTTGYFNAQTVTGAGKVFW